MIPSPATGAPVVSSGGQSFMQAASVQAKVPPVSAVNT